MDTMPAELLNLIVGFQPLFTKSTWENAQILLQIEVGVDGGDG